jgi:hypothetical protein
MKKELLILGLLLGVIFLSKAQNMDDRLIVESCDDFTPDGKGTNHQWSKTQWVNLSALNAESAYSTRVKVLYSTAGMYFLFDNQDQKIVSTISSDNENLWTEDVVEVFLWTDEKYPMYFEYEISPRNFELPILIPKVGEKFLGWLPWHYEGDRRTKHQTHIAKEGAQVVGWTAEFFIPYELLSPLGNVPPTAGTLWRANMYRIDYDQEQPVWWAWRPIVNNFHDHKLFGTFEFKP